MMLEIGKLYSCEKYYLLFYPYLNTATVAAALAADDTAGSVAAAARQGAAAYWTRRLGKPVSYLEKSTPILVLNMEKNFVEVLGGDRKGWIIIKDFLNIKEIE